MRTSFIRTIVGVILVTFIATSCATMPPPGKALTAEERAKAQKQCIANYTAAGVIGGAVVGALVGALTRDKKAAGALTGGAVGAVAGGTLAFALAWGHCMALYSDLKSYPVAGTQETAERVGYRPSQGLVIKIENFYLNPEGVSPGGQVQLSGTYYVMAPEGSKEVKVTESRAVHFYDASANEWKELGSVDNEIVSALGTRRADGNFELPSDVPEGQYRITLRVLAQGEKDQVTRVLAVKKGLAMGPINTQPQPQIQQVAEVKSPETEEYGAKSFGKYPKVGEEKKQFIEVISKTLNVRKKATSKSAPIAVIKQGEVYEALESETIQGEKWFRIRLDDGTEGWIQGKFAKLKE